MRILIADDSVVSRHLLEATLKKWSYDVEVACDGAEAWRMLQTGNAPRLAILDWVMPGLTGPDVCKRVRAREKEKEKEKEETDYTYILLLTSKSQREDLVEGMESGANDYLTKPFDTQELKVRIRAGASHIELLERLAALQAELRDQATKDFLTRVWNRSSILSILERELIRAQREQTPIGVVLADLDRFKSINDTFGHFAGDVVLKEFAERTQASIRTYDSLGRYGGEEFLIVLPGADEDGTRAQAERMRSSLAGEPIRIGDQDHHATSSFGATTWIPGASVNSEMLIRIADEALYMAKNQGRNRTVHLPCQNQVIAR